MVIGYAGGTTEPQFVAAKPMVPNRLWYQFSLRSCMVLTTAVCIWLGWHVRTANRRNEAIEAIWEIGGEVIDVDPTAAHKFHVLFAPHAFRKADGTLVIPPGQSYRGMTWPQLALTDDGLRHVARLVNVRVLIVEGAPITDAGLKHLHDLKGLERLALIDTRVTGGGIADLQRALPNCEIICDLPLEKTASASGNFLGVGLHCETEEHHARGTTKRRLEQIGFDDHGRPLVGT